MVKVGDLISGVDAYGNGVVGEVFVIGGGYVHMQPNRLKDNADKYVDLTPVMVREALCSVIEQHADRESNQQRDEWVARLRQAANDRRQANKAHGRERER